MPRLYYLCSFKEKVEINTNIMTQLHRNKLYLIGKKKKTQERLLDRVLNAHLFRQKYKILANQSRNVIINGKNIWKGQILDSYRL